MTQDNQADPMRPTNTTFIPSGQGADLGQTPITGVGEQGRRDLPTPDMYPGEQQYLVDEAPDLPQTQAEPKPPYPQEKLEKPGLEKEMSLKPQYMAPRYKAAGKLEGKVALITGGDSGIGRAVAVLYAREGADVAIVCTPVEQTDGEDTRRAVEAEGRRFIMILGDLTDPQFCTECVERCVRELGKLDILVSNAAWQNRKESLEELSEEEWQRTFHTNIDAYFHLSKAAIKHLNPGAAIIATSSEVGLTGSASLPDYSATKGAIIAFTKSLAQQLADKGIRANAVAPGPVWTPLNPADRGMSPEKIAQFGQKQPMQRAAQPEEIAPAYVFLASDADSSYISGIVLEETGGRTMPG
ncbi:MAG: short-chain dehydrogenase/reductase [Phycisphaerales bacterium]|nr:short-chain dehydrogenase/reductase [Phycisphaerales bacterium]MDB5301801.1 short-chain dehydrogenase/reductase [Phycisphaerales bacterium]